MEVAFEPLDGLIPKLDSLVARHPSLPQVALSVYDQGADRAAVWDSRTGQLIWSPEGLVKMCWRGDGREALLVREVYEHRPELHKVIVTRLQSEIQHFVERVTWPDAKRVGVGQLSFPTGWPGTVAYSPTGDLAACQWIEQCSSGFELLSIKKGGEVSQIQGVGYSTSPNLLVGPVFSPNGLYVVASVSEEHFWSEDYEEASPGGRLKAGRVVIGKARDGTYREVDVFAEVPPGWKPKDQLLENEMISEPVFVDDEEFQVVLPTGQMLSFKCGSLGKTA